MKPNVKYTDSQPFLNNLQFQLTAFLKKKKKNNEKNIRNMKFEPGVRYHTWHFSFLRQFLCVVLSAGIKGVHHHFLAEKDQISIFFKMQVTFKVKAN